MADQNEPGSRDETDDLLDPAEEAALRGEDGPTLVKGDDDALDIEIQESEDEDDEEDGDEPEGDEEKPAGDDAEPPAADDAPEEDADDPALPPPPVAFTEDDAKRQTAIAAAKDALFDQFDEGNLTKDEFKEKMRELETEDRALSAKHDGWTQYEADTTKAWNDGQEKWLKAHPDVVGLPPESLDAFDKLMRQYTGSGLGDGLSVAKQHDAVLAMFRERHPGVLPAAGAKPKADPAKPDKRHPADKERAKNPPESVPSLAKMPAVEQEDAADGEFARLDRLMERDFEAYEAAVARLTPEQEARYLAR